MKLPLMPEADSVNVQTLDMGRTVVDINSANITELVNKAAENGYSLRVVDDCDSTETPATCTSLHQLLQDNAVMQGIVSLTTETALLFYIRQAREDVLTLRHLQLLHQNR